jgi:hypothetical protein
MTELNITIDLQEEGRESMYERLCEEIGKQNVDNMIEGQVIDQITQMFDRRDQLKKQLQDQKL